MRKFILLVSAAAMAASMPALAKPGKGGGNSGAKAQTSVKAKAGPVRAKSTVRARTDARANTRARTRTGASVDRTRDIDRDGIPDYRDRNIARAGDASCPPGLARKDNGCLPPGQAKKIFAEGQRIPDGYNFFTDYSAIPERYRDDIPEMYRSGDYRYIYRDQSVYVVDPATRLVRGIFNLID